MSSGKLRRALAYAAIVPSAAILTAQLSWAIMEAVFKQKRAASHFRKGLVGAGVSKADAERITRACFNA